MAIDAKIMNDSIFLYLADNVILKRFD